MELKEIIAYINKLEDQFPVNDWEIRGVKIWPFLRIKLAFLIRQQQEHHETGRSGAAPASAPPASAVGASAAPRSAAGPAARTAARPLQGRLRQLGQLLRDAGYLLGNFRNIRKSSLVFTGNWTHRVELNGSWYNRYFDPLKDWLEANRGLKAVYLETSEKKDGIAYHEPGRIFFLPYLHRIGAIGLLFSSKRKQISLKGYERLETMIFNDFPGLKQYKLFSQARLVRRFLFILSNSSLYKRLLRMIKPRAVFVLCYYNEDNFALLLAANQLGIKTIELQHGPQTTLHPAYGSWSNVAAEGYHLLPRIFWTWDELSREVISRWAANTRFHKALNKGNPWVIACRSGYVQGTMPDPDKPLIIYSLQPVQPLIPEPVQHIIKETCHEFSWWLRLHPSQTPSIDAHARTLEQLGLDAKVEIRQASSIPLPMILAKSALHMTRSSGSTLEASYFGVKTILLGKTGAEYYRDLINRSEAVDASECDEKQLLALIRANVQKKGAISSGKPFGQLCREIETLIVEEEC